MEDEPARTAREMIRIFGADAENLAASLRHKFTRRGDDAGIKTWDGIARAIGALRATGPDQRK